MEDIYTKNLHIIQNKIESLSDKDIKSLQMHWREPTKEDLIKNIMYTDGQTSDDKVPTEATKRTKEYGESLNQDFDGKFNLIDTVTSNINDAIEQENKWRHNHSQRAEQIDTAIDVFQELDDNHRTLLKEYYDVDDDFDLIDTLGDYDELFTAQDAQGNELDGKNALRQNIEDIYSQEMHTPNLNDGLDDLSNLSQNTEQEQ